MLDEEGLSFTLVSKDALAFYNSVLKPKGYKYKRRGECGRGVYSPSGDRMVADVFNEYAVFNAALYTEYTALRPTGLDSV